MKIRPFNSTDLAAIADLFTASVHQLAEPHYDAVQRAAWAPRPPDLGYWQKRLDAVSTLVAEDGNCLIGFISYEHNGHIDMLFLSPTHTRRGIASLLYHTVESELAAIGTTNLFTEASLIAQPFFERQGFRVIGEQTVQLRGTVFRRFAMVKQNAVQGALN